MSDGAFSGQAPEEQWDVVVRARVPWWRVDARELWSYRDLLLLLVRRDLLAVYKQTILGPAWQVVQPLLTSIVFAVVFGLMARLSLPGIPALLFYMSALVPWALFNGVVTRISQTLVWNAALMTKVYFPRLVPPVATTLSTSFNFLVQLVSLFLFAVFYSATGRFDWGIGAGAAMLPVLVLLLLAIAFGLGLIVASLSVRYRDLSFLIGFALQLLMYSSPVIFPLSRVEEGSILRRMLEVNPLTPIIEGFRAAFFGLPMDWGTLWYSAGVGAALLVLGLIMFQRVQRSFADVV